MSDSGFLNRSRCILFRPIIAVPICLASQTFELDRLRKKINSSFRCSCLPFLFLTKVHTFTKAKSVNTKHKSKCFFRKHAETWWTFMMWMSKKNFLMNVWSQIQHLEIVSAINHFLLYHLNLTQIRKNARNCISCTTSLLLEPKIFDLSFFAYVVLCVHSPLEVQIHL